MGVQIEVLGKITDGLLKVATAALIPNPGAWLKAGVDIAGMVAKEVPKYAVLDGYQRDLADVEAAIRKLAEEYKSERIEGLSSQIRAAQAGLDEARKGYELMIRDVLWERVKMRQTIQKLAKQEDIYKTSRFFEKLNLYQSEADKVAVDVKKAVLDYREYIQMKQWFEAETLYDALKEDMEFTERSRGRDPRDGNWWNVADPVKQHMLDYLNWHREERNRTYDIASRLRNDEHLKFVDAMVEYASRAVGPSPDTPMP